jgi:hypothetical protein
VSGAAYRERGGWFVVVVVECVYCQLEDYVGVVRLPFSLSFPSFCVLANFHLFLKRILTLSFFNGVGSEDERDWGIRRYGDRS